MARREFVQPTPKPVEPTPAPVQASKQPAPTPTPAPTPKPATSVPSAAPVAPAMPSASDIQKRLDGQNATPALPFSTPVPAPARTPTYTESRPTHTASRGEAANPAYMQAVNDVRKYINTDPDFDKLVKRITEGSTSQDARGAQRIVADRTMHHTEQRKQKFRADQKREPTTVELYEIEDRARNDAIGEIAALKTAGVWTGTILLPSMLDTPVDRVAEGSKPVTTGDIIKGTIAGPMTESLRPRVEVVGLDKDGLPVLRQEGLYSYTTSGLMNLGITPFVSTGVPDVLAQKAFGTKTGEEPAELLSPADPRYIERATRMMTDRRTYSDVAQDTEPETLAGQIAVNTLGVAADVISPDPVFNFALPALGKTGGVFGRATRITPEVVSEAARIEKALDRVGEATRAEREVTGSAVRRAEDVTDPTVANIRRGAAHPSDDVRKATASLDDATRAAEDVFDTAAGSYSRQLAEELDNRTMAALVEEGRFRGLDDLLIRGAQVNPLPQAAVRSTQRVADVLRTISRSLQQDTQGVSNVVDEAASARALTDSRKAAALLETLTEARGKALESLVKQVQDVGRTSQVDDVLRKAGGVGSYDAVASALLDNAPRTVDQVNRSRKVVEDLIERGAAVLDAATGERVVRSLERLTGELPPVGLVPQGRALSARDMVRIDEWMVDVAKRQAGPTGRDALVSATMPKLWAERVGLDPKGFAGRVSTAILDKIVPALRTPLIGTDVMKPWERAGLSASVRQSTIEATRQIEAVLSDIGKLGGDPAKIKDYLTAKDLGRAKRGLLTSGQNYFDLFAQAWRLGLVDRTARRALAQAFVPDGTRLPDEVVKGLEEAVERGLFGGPDQFFSTLIEATQQAIPRETVRGDGLRISLAPMPGGGHARVAAIIGSHGSLIPIYEKWFGEGVLLTERQYADLVDSWTGGVGRVADRSKRSDLLGSSMRAESNLIIASDDFAHWAERARISTKRRDKIAADIADLESRGIDATMLKPQLVEQETKLAKAVTKRDQAARVRDQAQRDMDELATQRPQILSGRTLHGAEEASRIKGSAIGGDPRMALGVIETERAGTFGQSLVTAGLSKADARKVETVRLLVEGGAYVPRMVREELGKTLDQAASRLPPESGSLGKLMLRLFARGVTRGIFLTNPKHHLNNYYGDFEQIAMTHGFGVAIQSQIENSLQQVMAIPIVGQAAEAVGGETLRRGVLSAPERVGQSVEKIRAAVASKSPTLDRLLGAGAQHADVNKLLDGSRETVRLGGRSYTYEQLRAAAVRGGVMDSMDTAELASQILNETPTWWQRLQGENPLSRTVQGVAEGISERRRMGLYRIMLERGATPDEAARGVVDALFDYKHSLTDSERGVIRYLLPFWSWQKNSNRMMYGAILSPKGAWKIRALAIVPDRVGEIISDSVDAADAHGALLDQMKLREDAGDGEPWTNYRNTLAYLKAVGVPEDQIQTILTQGDLVSSRAPYGFGMDPTTRETGGQWPETATGPNGGTIQRPTTQQIVEFMPYVVPDYGTLSTRAYLADRPRINMRGTLADPSNGLQNPSDFYAFLLPPSATEAALNWAGGWAGFGMAALSAVATSDPSQPSPIANLQAQVDPFRAPLVGPILSSLPKVEGSPSQLVKSDLMGSSLMYVGLAEASGSPGGTDVRYRISNPWTQLAYQSMPGLSDADRFFELYEKTSKSSPQRARKLAEAWLGLSTADIRPRGLPQSLSSEQQDLVSKLPRTFSTLPTTDETDRD